MVWQAVKRWRQCPAISICKIRDATAATGTLAHRRQQQRTSSIRSMGCCPTTMTVAITDHYRQQQQQQPRPSTSTNYTLVENNHHHYHLPTLHLHRRCVSSVSSSSSSSSSSTTTTSSSRDKKKKKKKSPPSRSSPSKAAYPQYLIPPAYRGGQEDRNKNHPLRKHNNNNNFKSGSRGNNNNNRRSSSPYAKGRSNNNTSWSSSSSSSSSSLNSHHHHHHRSRRKSSPLGISSSPSHQQGNNNGSPSSSGSLLSSVRRVPRPFPRQQQYNNNNNTILNNNNNQGIVNNPPVDIDTIRQIEIALSQRMNDYMTRMNGISSSSLEFHDYAADHNINNNNNNAPTTTQLILGSSSTPTSYMDYLENIQKEHDTTATTTAATTTTTTTTVHHHHQLSDLYATQTSYEMIEADFKTLIVGWSEVAKSICTAKRWENSMVAAGKNNGDNTNTVTPDNTNGLPPKTTTTSSNDGNDDDDPTSSATLISASDYEDAVFRAERHLESFEVLSSNRANAFTEGNAALEKLKKHREEEAGLEQKKNENDVMGKLISSFFGGILFNNSTKETTTTSDFDRSWKLANGKHPTSAATATSMGSVVGSSSSSSSDSFQSNNCGMRDMSMLYERVLVANHPSYCFGSEAKERSTQRSNRLLNRWISLYCLSSSSSSSSSSSKNEDDDAAVSADSDDDDDDDDGITNTNKKYKRPIFVGTEEDERKLFHAVIQQNVDLSTVNGVARAEDWLGRMKNLKELGEGNNNCNKNNNDNCISPNVDTYNLVLLGFCNLSKALFRHTNHQNRPNSLDKDEEKTKQFIVDGVERVMLELTQYDKNNEGGGGGPSPNVVSMNLALNALAKAGRNSPETTRQKTNSLLFNIIGERNYRRIFATEGMGDNGMQKTMLAADDDDDGASNRSALSRSCKFTVGVDKHHNCMQSEQGKVTQNNSTFSKSDGIIHPNLDTYHWIVDIYCATGNIVYTKQGMSLLRKMIRIRSEEKANDFSICKNSRSSSSRNAAHPASFAPSAGTHNSVLRALVETTVADTTNLNVIRASSGSHGAMMHGADKATTAKEVNAHLDSMVQYGSSFPTPVTFLLMLQLWQNSHSTEAGVYAEEILSRMEIVGMYQDELKNFSNAYVLALECWLTAAKAGRSGAAECAFRLLKMAEAQALSDDTFSGVNRSMLPLPRMYPLMMSICASTNGKQDASRAMAIAFKVYDKMVHDNIKPSPIIFEMLYICVRNFLDRHPEEERQGLLGDVFERASKHGITRGEVMGRRKQLLRPKKGYYIPA